MKGIKFLCLIILMNFLSACGLEIDPRTLWHNRKGAQQMQAGEASEAQKSFLQALGIDPFISEVHTNLGLSYHALKQGDQALQSYESAEKWAKNDQARFAARFNQGVIRGENKKIEEALLAYQRALEVKPDSIEAKTNIELLIQGQGQDGKGENKDQNQQGGGGSGDQEKKDKGENKDDQKEQDQQANKKVDPKGSPQYKPREFKGDLPESEVKKILGELKQQEQKIRGQFYRNESKEQPRDKDW